MNGHRFHAGSRVLDRLPVNDMSAAPVSCDLGESPDKVVSHKQI